LESKNPDKFSKEIEKQSFFVRKRNWIIISSLILLGIFVRWLYFEPNIPVTYDALSHFFYAKDISITGTLPPNYSPANNGWPIFVSFFFKIFSFESTIQYMDLQKWISLIISTLTIIPVYVLSRKFFDEKISIVCASIFIFEPRLIYNSLLGITEPLYIFLGTISIVFFLSEKRKLIFISFAIIALTSLIRSEGLLLFFGMTIMFFIRFRKDRLKVFFKYLIAIAIFLIIILPMTSYRIDAAGYDTLFGRIAETAIYVSQDPIQTDSKSGIPYIFKAIENFVKFLGWDLIPLFIIFVPIGIIFYFKKLDMKKISLIVFLICLSFPALHAYGGSNLDTRYLYMFYPIFCIISGFTIKEIYKFSSKKNFLTVIIIGGVLVSSITFLEIREMNFESEKEFHEISKKIDKFKPIINDFYPASGYIETAQIPSSSTELEKYFFKERDERISIRHTIPHHTTLVQIEGFDTTNYFKNVQEKSLSHIVIDIYQDRPKFFKHIYENEKDYPFLEKVFDSKEEGFDYQVKMFKINYEILEHEKLNNSK